MKGGRRTKGKVKLGHLSRTRLFLLEPIGGLSLLNGAPLPVLREVVSLAFELIFDVLITRG